MGGVGGSDWAYVTITLLGETSLVSKRPPPELCGVGFRDPEVVSLEQTVGEDGFELGEHVAEDQGQLGQVTPGGGTTNRPRAKASAVGSSEAFAMLSELPLVAASEEASDKHLRSSGRTFCRVSAL